MATAVTAKIDVWVDDGGSWACAPSVLYKIPTEIFDYHMMMGSLCTREDLDALIEKLANDKVTYVHDEYTEIWVAMDGSWSGYPSVHFSIPVNVFQHLLGGDPQKTISRLTCQFDLERLIEKSLQEMETGVRMVPIEVEYSRPTNTELKLCGHVCTISSVKDGCCKCADTRPMREEGTYPAYVDGEGWSDSATRDAGYCPFCTPLPSNER